MSARLCYNFGICKHVDGMLMGAPGVKNCIVARHPILLLLQELKNQFTQFNSPRYALTVGKQLPQS